jgi:hypothetical protein
MAAKGATARVPYSIRDAFRDRFSVEDLNIAEPKSRYSGRGLDCSGKFQ